MIPPPWRSAQAIPKACLFLSGLTSLTYELLWVKQLKLLYGGTLYAISAVLCAFMAGLALGAWGVGRLLRNPRLRDVQPVRLYGLLEGGIGLYGLAFPVLLKLMAPLYPALTSLAGGSDAGLHFLEFLLSTLIMLPATFLMGATLPVLGGWAIADPRRIFPGLSLLYSLNTFGAVAGCLLTQFVAAPRLGILGTNGLAVALNLLVMALCFYWQAPEAAGAPPLKQAPPAEAASRRLGLFLLLLFGYSGLVALASEILWTRILVFPLGSSLYSFTIILATFLFGIALGSLVAERLLGNSNWITKFILLEGAIGLFCLLLFPALDQVTAITLKADSLFYDLGSSAWQTLGIRTLIAFGLMVVPTFGFGLVFPLANHIHFSLFGNVTGTLGNSYAVNTVGAILGTVLTPFVLIPLWGIQLSLYLLYAALVLLAAAAWGMYRGGRAGVFAAGGAVLVLAGAYFMATPSQDTGQLGDHNLARIEINASRDQLKLLDYREGDFSTLSVIEEAPGGARTLYIDGFSTATASESIGGSAYMQAMGWVPMMLHPDPKRALVMCFGTGNTLGTVARFPGVSVDGVEIDRNVLALADWFEAWNHGVLKRDNVRVHLQDGRNFIRWTANRYDVITLEPMSPVQAGVNNLYSREFYEQARARLNPGGLMMQWLPLHLVGPEDAWAIVKTMRAVFPHVTVWNSFLTRIVLLVGSESPQPLRPEDFDRRMAAPEVRAMAEEIGIFSFVDFLDFYLAEADALTPALAGAPMITDDRPHLEYSMVNLVPPLKQETDETFLNLLRHRLGPGPVLEGLDPEQEAYFRENQELRTAQRMSVFVQRYGGPGAQAFRRKRYDEGLASVRAFLERMPDGYIRLEDEAAGWRLESPARD